MRVNSIHNTFFKPKVNLKSAKKLNYVSIPQMNSDMVSFKAKANKKDVNVDIDKAKFVANSLSTSTSGHRAEYGGENFTPDIVRLITLGVADFAKEEAQKNGKEPTVLIGGDTRIASRESLPLIKDTLLKQNVDVINIKEPVPTPLLAIAAKNNDVDIAILMTASHNPWKDGGFNLVTKAGAIAPASVTKEIAKEIVKHAEKGSFVEYEDNNAKETKFYPYELYKKEINDLSLIDWDNIKNSGLKVYYDGLKGSGIFVMPKILDDYKIPYTEVISSGQEGPNPNEENLAMLGTEVSDSNEKLRLGIANDGDADRFGVVDENGKFITPNDVLTLVAYHLAKNKGIEGTIIRSQATSMQLDGIAEKFNSDLIQTPVGFKYIAEDIEDLRKNNKDILLAGEESGGLTVHGHIPEKDGIVALLLVMDLIATEHKPVSEILSDIKQELPNYYVNGDFSKHLKNDDDKNIIMKRVENILNKAVEGDTAFGDDFEIDTEKSIKIKQEMEHYKKGGDGVKLFLTDGSTVLVRKSGTESLVRCYIVGVGEDEETATNSKDKLQKIMNEIFEV